MREVHGLKTLQCVNYDDGITFSLIFIEVVKTVVGKLVSGLVFI